MHCSDIRYILCITKGVCDLDITSFTGEYEFLSNSYHCPFEYDGVEYACVTTAYWALSVKDHHARTKIARLRFNKAKAKAINMAQEDDWEQKKVGVMYKLLQIKFSKPELREKLLGTGNAKLINNVTYFDDFYGVKDGRGMNLLGKLLMKLRDELRFDN